MARSFSTTPLTISTAISAYGAATAASAFFLAARIDRIGIRRTLLGGMLALIAALLLSAAAPHWLALTLARPWPEWPPASSCPPPTARPL